MLLPEMATGGGGGGGRSRRAKQGATREGGGLEGCDSPRHVVMTAKSGAWAASSQAHKVLPPAVSEDE